MLAYRKREDVTRGMQPNCVSIALASLIELVSSILIVA